jgi:hypothetical protein
MSYRENFKLLDFSMELPASPKRALLPKRSNQAAFEQPWQMMALRIAGKGRLRAKSQVFLK